MITNVAIKVNSTVYSLPSPNRHHDLIRLAIESGEPKPIDGHGENSGFLDDEGHFLNRNTAGAVAFKSGQTKTRIKRLNTDDVW